jgi:hypothetical protein
MYTTAMKTAMALIAALATAGATLAAEPAAGIDLPRYSTPVECPGFAMPRFISRPLGKAYPGLEYSMRPAIKGGEYPYAFALAKAPVGMKIDAHTGAITWMAPAAEGIHDVEISLKDSGGRGASQPFKLAVTTSGFYFLSPLGDDAAEGSLQKPWKTVMRAAKPPEGFSYPPGAVVILRGGEYKVQVPAAPGKTNENVLALDARSPKYWLAYPGEKPVIDLGFSAEKQKAAHQQQAASGRLEAGKEPSTQGYGHRIALVGGSDYLYMDGLEVKNACYYMFVMWDGRNTINFRRMDLHDLWSDWAENPSFVFTFAGDRKGDFNAWGVRPACSYYRDFVIQDCHMHDRFYIRERGSHGGAMVFYTVRDAVVEDNVIENIQRGECFCDKDNGYGNTYRGNVLRGQCSLLGQWNNDETEICDNYIEGELRVGLQPGWLRNIWIHHNAVRGTISLMGGGTSVPEKLDEKSGDFAKATTADSAKAIRDFPAARRLVHFYRNIISAPASAVGESKPLVILRLPNSKSFAERWRYVRWNQNVVDARSKVELLWNQYTDFSIMKNCGFEAQGLLKDVKLEAGLSRAGLPADLGVCGPRARP